MTDGSVEAVTKFVVENADAVVRLVAVTIAFDEYGEDQQAAFPFAKTAHGGPLEAIAVTTGSAIVTPIEGLEDVPGRIDEDAIVLPAEQEVVRHGLHDGARFLAEGFGGRGGHCQLFDRQAVRAEFPQGRPEVIPASFRGHGCFTEPEQYG